MAGTASKKIDKENTTAGKGSGTRSSGKAAGRNAAKAEPGVNKLAKTTSGKGTSGKTAAGKTTRKQVQEPEPIMEEEESFLRSEVFVIASFALAVLLFLSNFHLCGVVGDYLRKVQLGTFGMIGFIAPLLLFVGTCFAMSNKGNPIAALKLSAVIVGVLVLCGLVELVFGDGFKEGQKLLEVFERSAVNGFGGGLVGGALVMGIGSMLGTVGAYLVLFVLLAICAVCITEKSLVAAVKRGGDRAYQYAKEDADRRRVIHEERKEERKRLREEQRVRGVNLQSTKLEAMSHMDDMDKQLMEEEQLLEEEEQLLEEETSRMAVDFLAELEEEAADSGTVPGADVFTGKITMPSQYIDQEEDTVPFDVDDGPGLKDGQLASRTMREVSYVPGQEIPDDQVPGTVIPDSFVKEETKKSEIRQLHVQKDMRTLEEMEIVDDLSGDGPEADTEIPVTPMEEFSIPEESKRVVTASGKIIESDTEALKKKLEKRKEEARESGDLSVAQQIEEKPVIKKEYQFPPLTLLKRSSRIAGSYSEKEYKETAIKLQQTLRNFGVGVTVTNVSCGPSVTRYELHPEQGVKVSKIVGLADDIKLSLAASDIRIEAPIPGKSAVGIEVPNKENNVVYLRDLLEADEFKNSSSRLSFAVGKDIGGQVVVTDVAKMPHLLIAGATGSGKSVCINTLIMSLIYKANPDDVKMIMIDPKVVELSAYNGIPHLLIPVVTDPKKASGALNWAVAEMMDRYKKFAEYNVRDLKGYNAKVEAIKDIEDDKKPQKLPQIVIIVDELADLMMVSPGEVEDAICRLAQLARAAGLHLVIATQRPSVNVITGLIKANVPSRIAFSVSSGVDSRTIIDMNGAEKLLGKGDMLFYPAGYQKPQRVQGAFVSDQEVAKVVEFLTSQDMTPEYNPEIESQISMPVSAAGAENKNNGRDEYFAQAAKFIIEKDKGSIGMLQRMFKIGFNRAARIMDQLAEAGVVGEEEGTKPRKVLMTLEEFETMLANENES